MPNARFSLLPMPTLPWGKQPLLPLVIFSSGILMGLATAPLNLYPLAWIALVPLWVLLFGRGKASGRSHLLLAGLWGMGYHGFALSWILGLHPLTWMGVPWLASVGIAGFCWLFITGWGAALVILWAGLMARVDRWLLANPRLPLYRVLIGTALWCGLEGLWSLGALYWTALSYTQSPGNLAILHLGQISGPGMVSAAIVAVNGCFAEACLAYQRREGLQSFRPAGLLSLGMGLLVSLHLLGATLAQQPLNDQANLALPVGIIQGNVPTRIKLSPQGIRQAVNGYTQGYERLVDQGMQAVLTPEGALPFLWQEEQWGQHPFAQVVVARGVVAWLGTFVSQQEQITQSLLTLTSEGRSFSRYNKIKLVPLGEYIPFQAWIGGLIDRLSPIKADMVPGSSDQRFDTPFGRAIASICYESAFPELFRAQAADGGQFILTASNLDPYSEVLMAQHQAQDLMRAIETDRWAVRATNTGYSGMIDPHGQIRWRSQPHTYAIHGDTIYRRQTQTPYVRWGDWLTPLLLLLSLLILGWAGWQRSTQKGVSA